MPLPVDRLAHSIAVYVPSTQNIDQKIDNAAIVNNTLARLSHSFGGCTAINARGAWVSDVVGLVVEDVTICKSFAHELTENDLQTVLDLAEQIKRDMTQEAVSIEVDGTLFFV